VKIALYGVSRSGKNYFIEKLIERLKSKGKEQIFHLEGSVYLFKMAQKKFKKHFKLLTENEKSVLRSDFPKTLREKERVYGNVIVDCHYAFISEDGYNVVLTDSEKDAYDAIFYIDTPSDMIENYSKNSEGEKKNLSITAEQIRLWKKFDIENLQNICQSLNTELIILDENTENCLDFMELFLSKTDGFSFIAKKIALQIITEHSDLISSHQEIVVLDCDKTISENDVTYDFCESLGIDRSVLKQNFKNNRYSLYQFYNIARSYHRYSESDLNRASDYAKSKVKLNDLLLKDVKKNRSDSLTIGLTSGVHRVWESISQEISFPQLLIGCHDLKRNKYLISTQVKLEFVKQLKKLGKTVYAIGDSPIDKPMLEVADKGFIVAHEKLNNGMTDYFKNSPTKIQQLAYSQFKYENIQLSGGIR
jgi:hydroxymethylpyrimidine pyrophosphatase-like HAD family hydrolase